MKGRVPNLIGNSRCGPDSGRPTGGGTTDRWGLVSMGPGQFASFSGAPPVPGLCCGLLHLRSLLQTEILLPVTAPSAGTTRLRRLHRGVKPCADPPRHYTFTGKYRSP